MSAFIPPDSPGATELGHEHGLPPGRRPRRYFLAGAGAAVVGSVLAAVGESARSVVVPGRSGFPAVAGASPGSGLSRSGLGRGIVTRGASINVEEGTDVIVDSITIVPGGATGWHTHPGPELLVVTKGVVTFRRSDGLTCVTERVSAGQAFVGAAAGELHAAHNQDPDPAEFVVVFFDVPAGGASRSEGDPPLLCP